MTLNEAMMLRTLPKIDLHGETSAISRTLINDFIKDQWKMKHEYAEIIFGNGTGILRNTTYQVLKKNKLVLEFKSPYNNSGSVVIKLDLTKK